MLSLWALSSALAVGDKFPVAKLPVRPPAVVFFYGADDAPTCSKQLKAFEAAAPDFQKRGVSLVGVRNEAGAKAETAVKTIVDEQDELRNELAIPKDFGLLGGRQTYVLDKAGTVISVHNNQFDAQSHVKVAQEAIEELPKPFDLEDSVKQAFGVLGINIY